MKSPVIATSYSVKTGLRFAEETNIKVGDGRECTENTSTSMYQNIDVAS